VPPFPRAGTGARLSAPIPAHADDVQPPSHPPITVERTLILLKPDALHRGLAGPIISRFERKGLRIVGLKLRQFPEETIREHYSVHADKPFYDNLVGFMTSSPVLALCLEGKDAIAVARRLIGATDSSKADPGTIRGDLGLSFSNNLVHGSDSLESSNKELALFFPGEDELVDWTPASEAWVYSSEES